MRIAQIAPLYESVPPKAYGGTERIVSYLTEALVEEGHDVTLFASADSRTSARLSPQSPVSLRLSKDRHDDISYNVTMIEHVYQRRQEFDIIHSHIDYMIFPTVRRSATPVVTTLHGRLNLPDLVPLYKEFSDVPVISISDYQRKPLPFANWIGTVYHGLPRDLYRPNFSPGRYLAFLGRISPEKDPVRAIDLAVRAGIPIKLAAKVDKKDQEYYESLVKPKLKHPLVEFLGEISDRDKSKFLGESLALLFPICWPEPFGIVMIEAMACGTPVVAFRCGSVPEVIDPGVTGYICRNDAQMLSAIRRCEGMDRAKIRATFERRFTSKTMMRNYLKIYARQLQQDGAEVGGQVV